MSSGSAAARVGDERDQAILAALEAMEVQCPVKVLDLGRMSGGDSGGPGGEE